MELDGRNAIALEVQYHRTCYRDFTYEKSLERLTERQLEDEDEHGNSSAHKAAFEGLVQYLDDVLSDQTAVVTLNDIVSKYRYILRQCGGEESQCWPHVLNARIKAYYRERISFHRPSKRNEPEYVFSTRQSRGPLL